MKRKKLTLTLEQQRDMLRSLLDQVEAQLAPPELNEVQGPMAGMPLIEQWEHETKAKSDCRLPIIEIDKEGIATLSNVDSRDLTDILTMASLWHHANKYKPAPVVRSQFDPNGEHALAVSIQEHKSSIRTSVLCDFLSDAMSYGISEHNSKFHNLKPHVMRTTYAKRRREEEINASDTQVAFTSLNEGGGP